MILRISRSRFDDEDQALLLLCSLPKSHAHFKETLLYGRESLTFEDAQFALYFKDLNERKEHKPSSVGEGLSVKMVGLRIRRVKFYRILMVVMLLLLSVIIVRRRVIQDKYALIV